MDQLAGKLTIRHLRLVIAIAEENSLVRAAKRLNMTQPAVTKSLQAAEHQLGVSLFSRTSAGLVPTIYGAALIARARLVIAQLNHAAQEIIDLRDGAGGRVAIGTLLAASAGLLPKAIALLRRQRPKLIITVMEGTDDVLLPALHSGKLDLVVGRIPEFRESAELSQEVLLIDEGCVVTRPGHPLVGREDLGLADLVGGEWILPPQETTLRGQIDRAFRDVGVDPPTPAIEGVSLLMNRSLLQLTDYLNVWSWQVARLEAAAGLIAILPVTLPPTISPIGMTLRLNTPLSPAAETMAQTLRLVAAELEGYSRR